MIISSTSTVVLHALFVDAQLHLCLYVPHNYMNQFHGCVIQSVEKVQENASFFAHLPNDEAKSHTEDDKTQHVDSI